MLQDISPHKMDITYININPSADDYILVYKDDEICLADSDFITYKNIEKYIEAKDLLYLFKIDNKRFFLLCAECDINQFSVALKAEHIRIFRQYEPDWAAFAMITGYSVYRWQKTNKFCGCCGTKTKFSELERAIICPNCKNIEYPKISPAVIVAVYNDDKLLMTKYSDSPYKKYALVAGYAEIGETLEDAAKREVMEEVGLKIKNLKYYNSQPWALTQSLLVGFYAELDGSPEVKLDKNELKEAVWFKREDIPADDTTLSLTWEMIDKFKNNQISNCLQFV